MLKRKFRFDDAWQCFVPTGWEEVTEALVLSHGHAEPLEPLGDGPLAPEVEAPREAHIAPCACPACMANQSEETRGQRYNDYVRAQALEWDCD